MREILFCGCEQLNSSDCLGAFEKKYLKGETIAIMSKEIKRIGIIQSGKAHITCTDTDGTINITERLGEGSVFGEIFAMSNENLIYSIEADTDCVIEYISYDRIVKPCGNNCENHCRLLNNLFHMAASKTRNLMVHINILSRRSTRQKLLTYFDSISNDNLEFILPYSFTELAEYICSDRSAMMREIKNMKDEGIILLNGKNGKILQKKYSGYC